MFSSILLILLLQGKGLESVEELYKEASLQVAFEIQGQVAENVENEQEKYDGQYMDSEKNEQNDSNNWSHTAGDYQQTEISGEAEILQECEHATGQISISEDDLGELPLHESVFRGNWKKFTNLLKKGYDVTERDKHGNTALHLAAMLGRKDYIEHLVEFNPPMRSRNISGWSAMDEAVSYRNEDIVNMMLPFYTKQFLDGLKEKRRQLISELENLEDFYLEMRWDFTSWIPGLAYLLPSDTCKIRKRGSSIRMDTTLAGFDVKRLRARYKRKRLSYLFDSKTSPNPTVYFLDDDDKSYSKLDMKIEAMEPTEAKDLFESGISYVTMSRSCIAFQRLGDWLRTDKMIGRFKAQYYDVKHMVVRFRRRTEHLSKQQLKNRAVEAAEVSNFLKNSMQGKEVKPEDAKVSQDEDDQVAPVPPSQVTWEEYINSPPGKYPTLARPMRLTEQPIKVKTTVGMSKQVELPVGTFVKILQVIAPFKHFDKLREFLQLRLPEGFPVKLEIPLFATLSARITFPEFKYCSEAEDCFPEQLFHIPEDYKESGPDI